MNASPAVRPAVNGRAAAAMAADLIELQRRSREAAALLKALANPDRLMLLCHLLEQERTVAELGQTTGIAQPSLSQQLGVLRQEALVATRREGKHVHYRVASPAVPALLQALHRLYCAPRRGPTH